MLVAVIFNLKNEHFCTNSFLDMTGSRLLLMMTSMPDPIEEDLTQMADDEEATSSTWLLSIEMIPYKVNLLVVRTTTTIITESHFKVREDEACPGHTSSSFISD